MKILLLALLCACSTSAGVYDRVSDPDNVIHNYEWFHTSYTNTSARASQISSTKELLAIPENSEAEKSRLRIELAGQQQSCRELVANYNANSAKATQGIFRGTTLPKTLNPSICE